MKKSFKAIVLILMATMLPGILSSQALVNRSLTDTTRVLYTGICNLFEIPLEHTIECEGCKVATQYTGRTVTVCVTVSNTGTVNLNLMKEQKKVRSVMFAIKRLPQIRIAIGDTLKDKMAIDQITVKPTFRAYHIGAPLRTNYRIKQLKVTIEDHTGAKHSFDLQESLIRNNPMSAVKPPVLGPAQLELIRNLKKGGKITLSEVIILPVDGPGTQIGETVIDVK